MDDDRIIDVVAVTTRRQSYIPIMSIKLTSKNDLNQSILNQKHFNKGKAQKFAFRCDRHNINSHFEILKLSCCDDSVYSNPCLIIPFFHIEFLTCDGVFRVRGIEPQGGQRI
jgi:hypothetical protein